MKPCVLSLAGLAILVLTSGVAGAAVYKWTDTDGKVHFSDQPPPESAQTAETVDVRTTTDPYTRQRLEQYQREADLRAAQRATAREEAAAAEQEKARLETHCRTTRERLERLRTARRPQFVNDAGEREFIDEERRQAWIAEAEAELARTCQ